MVAKRNNVSFEDALTMTGYGKFNLLMFTVCSSVITGMVFEVFSVSYLVPASACELNTTSTQQGIMAGIPLTGVIMTSHIWGYLADTRGRRKILSICMSIGFIAGSIAAFSPDWISFSVFKFTSSAALGGAFALSMTLLSECTLAAKRSSLVILTTTVFMFSSGLMALISIPVLPLKFSYHISILNIHFNSWRLLSLIFSAPSAACAVAVACTYESPKYLVSIRKEEEALKTLRGIFMINSGKSGSLYQVDSVILDEKLTENTKGIFRSMLAQTLPLLQPPLLKRTLLIGLLFAMSYIALNPFMVWLPFIVNSFISPSGGNEALTLCQMAQLFMDTTKTVQEPSDCTMNKFAMLVVFGMNTILSIFNMFLSSLVSWAGRKRVFIGLQIIAGLSGLCVNLSSIKWLSAIFFVIFLLAILNFGLLTTYSVDIFPTYVRAMAVCLTLMVGRGSAVIGINVLKILIESHCEVAFYIFGSVTICSGLIGVLIPSDTQLLKLKEEDSGKP
ncbi:putative transporter svop-1 [Bombyx mandarina]|uniref:Transporter svop-1 n=1 Tax=Bombyx mandarina TaxID=7092 RepID=A0A6J2J9P6_BOMMA|nr:putative transporter svop-1 [Bombyx mandarina]